MHRSTWKEVRRRLLGPVAFLAITCGVALPAFAYVGPGAGLSMVGAFWGLLLAVFAALAFVVVWPVRRLLKRRPSAEEQAAPPAAPESGDPELSRSGQQ